MPHFKKLLFLALSSIGLISAYQNCSQKDFTGKAISDALGGTQSSSCTNNKTGFHRTIPYDAGPSLFELHGKLLISENQRGLVSLSQTQTEAVIKKDRELTVLTNEKCLSDTSARSLMTDGIIPMSGENSPSVFARRRKVPNDIALSDFASDVQKDPCVIGVEDPVDYQIAAQPTDPRYANERHMPNIKAPAAYDVFYHSTNGIKDDVVIAVIDSGVAWQHQDLVDSMWRNSDEVPGNNTDDDNNGYRDDVYGYDFINNSGDPTPRPWTGQAAGSEKHGTHVAGLAAARSNNGIGVAGVNGGLADGNSKRGRIMGLNVFTTTGGGSDAAIGNAIRYAADNGAHVINMSLGGTGGSEVMRTAMVYAIGKGVTIVSAAGNSNVNGETTPFYPAYYSKNLMGAVAVAATDSSSNARCSFSNYNGSAIEIAAPGCNGLHSTVLNNGYEDLQGTSMASPVTAGSVSLAIGYIKAKTGQWPTPETVERILLAGSRVQSGLVNGGVDVSKDRKVVDLVMLAAEIDRAYSGSAPPPPPPGGGSGCN